MTEAKDIWGDHAADLDGLLENASSDDSFERWAAAFELGELADPGAVDALKLLLNDPDEHVREAADVALRKLATGDGAARRSARVAVAEADAAAPAHRRRIRSHLDAAPFTPWKIKPVPVPTAENAWVVEASLMDIVLTEGPVPGSRLFRLYTDGCCMHGGTRASASRLHTAAKSLIQKGKIARSDSYQSDVAERWLLHERGTPGVVVRQRGRRELRDIAPEEVKAALESSLGRAARRGLQRDVAFEQILLFYQAEHELEIVGRLLANEWAGLLA